MVKKLSPVSIFVKIFTKHENLLAFYYGFHFSESFRENFDLANIFAKICAELYGFAKMFIMLVKIFIKYRLNKFTRKRKC
jgi:hypothetical protein